MNDITIGVISNVLYGLLIFGARWIALDIRNRNPRLPVLSFVVVWIVWVSMNLLAVNFFLSGSPRLEAFLIFFVISSSLLACFHWGQFQRFWAVGLRGADPQITKGINYEQALKLCKNQLEFLGTGAAKLTREREFEAALLRCRHDRPIKFLLCKPTADILTQATKRAGIDADTYRKVVLESLQKIARLRNDRKLNIEVRFYREPSIFRLMFIDDSICLTSYNLFGEGDGSQLPQLYVIKPPDDQRVVSSFFYPLRVYFDELWQRGDIWNFSDFLNSNG